MHYSVGDGLLSGHVMQATDHELLNRFIAAKDQSAFAELVERHGPMVLGLCRRLLRHHQDAEDVFQAAFLLLACKARSIRKREAVGSWLYGVAYRLATRLRDRLRRRQQFERPASSSTLSSKITGDIIGAVVWRELQWIIDEELNRLPFKYRSPLILCYLEGKSHREAAEELGWSSGSMSRRLEKARHLLRARLMERGITLSSAMIFGSIAGHSSAAVPPSLTVDTARSATAFASGGTTLGLVSTQALTLAQGGISTMFTTKVKLAAMIVLATGITGGGLGVANFVATDETPVQPASAANPKTDPTKAKPPTNREPSAQDRADADKPSDQPSLMMTADRLIRALESRTDKLRLGIDPMTTLIDALDFISKSHDITFTIDYEAFEEFLSEGRDDVNEKPVQLQPMPNVKLGIALRMLLDQADAAYVVREHDVLITYWEALVVPEAYPSIAAKLVYFSVKDLPLNEALDRLARQEGANIVLDRRVSDQATAPVTGRFQYVPVKRIVGILADMAGLKVVVLVGNVLYVTSPENAKRIEKEPLEVTPPWMATSASDLGSF